MTADAPREGASPPSPEGQGQGQGQGAVAGAAAPSPSAPSPGAAGKPRWTPPDTFGDKFSRWSTRAVQYTMAAFGLLSLVLFVLWVIPTVVVARSDAYAVAKASIVSSTTLTREAGQPIECATWPHAYTLGTPEGDLFKFSFEGATARGEVEVLVKDGKAVRGRLLWLGPRYY